jgi:hypothetical protein
VEGALDSKRIRSHSNNRVRHFVDTSRDFSSRNTHNGDAVLLEPRIALFVVLRPITHIMARPIDLNRETSFRTVEVQHIRADRMLPAKNRLSWQTRA